VTEVPDHLLQRSRDRRAALGGGSAAPSAPAGGSGGGDDGGSSAPVPAAAAATPAVIEPAAPPPPPPPYVQAALDRKKMPAWMAGAGVLTILWAFLYAGVLFDPGVSITDPVLAEGEEIFSSQCAGCHGGSGEGGTGRPLAGEVYLTFPNIEDHLAWITNGSPAPGTPYGDPNRPGGQHISQDSWGAMPAFGNSLTEEQILAVARYEREVLDSAPPPDGAAAAEGSEGGDGTNADSGEGDASSGADDPTNQAEAEGGSTDESSSSSEDADSSGSGETQGADEESEAPADADPDE
jgi:mono/diheme cytochrome c family protein